MSVPTPNDHLVQARANREHAEWLLTARPNDPTAMQWAVAAIFYSALHGITAHLMRQGILVRSHMARDRVLSNPSSGIPAGVYAAYRDLNDYSRDARYDLQPFSALEVQDLLDQQLEAVAAFVGM